MNEHNRENSIIKKKIEDSSVVFTIDQDVLNSLVSMDNDNLFIYSDSIKEVIDAAIDVQEKVTPFGNVQKTIEEIEEECKMTFKAFDFQKENVRTMLECFNAHGVFGDQVGLGKTIETLLTSLVMFRSGAIRNMLVISSPATVDNWYKDAKKFSVGGEPLFEFYPPEGTDPPLNDILKKIQDDGALKRTSPENRDNSSSGREKLKVYVLRYEKIANVGGKIILSNISYDRYAKNSRLHDGKEALEFDGDFCAQLNEAFEWADKNNKQLLEGLNRFGWDFCNNAETMSDDFIDDDPIVAYAKKFYDTENDEGLPYNNETVKRYAGRLITRTYPDLLKLRNYVYKYIFKKFYSKTVIKTSKGVELNQETKIVLLFNPDQCRKEIEKFCELDDNSFLHNCLENDRFFDDDFLTNVEVLEGILNLSKEKEAYKKLSELIDTEEKFIGKHGIENVSEAYLGLISAGVEEDSIDTISETEIFSKFAPIFSDKSDRNVDLLVIDEIHNCVPKAQNADESDLIQRKNVIFEFVKAIAKKYCILISATPLRTGLEDIFNIMYIADPLRYGETEEKAREYFYETVCNLPSNGRTLADMALDKESRKCLTGMINSIFTRKRISAVNNDLRGDEVGNVKEFLENLNDEKKSFRENCLIPSAKFFGKLIFGTNETINPDKINNVVRNIENRGKEGLHGESDNILPYTIFYRAMQIFSERIIDDAIIGKKKDGVGIGTCQRYMDYSRHEKEGIKIKFPVANDEQAVKELVNMLDEDTPSTSVAYTALKRDNVVIYIKKTDMRDKVRDGLDSKDKDRVLFATKTMQAGTNLQNYGALILAQMDTARGELLQPVDLEQWIGRIYRTGQIRQKCYVFIVLKADRYDENLLEKYYDILADEQGLDLFGKGDVEVSFLQPIIISFFHEKIYKKARCTKGKFEIKLLTSAVSEDRYTVEFSDKVRIADNPTFTDVLIPFLENETNNIKTISITKNDKVYDSLNFVRDVIRFFCALDEFKSTGNK